MLFKKNYSMRSICFFLLAIIITISDYHAQSWVWIKGSNTPFSDGNYGSIGVVNINNNPRARGECVTFIDIDGNLWLFGGDYTNSTLNIWPYLNDLWKYDIISGNWTWIKGSSNPDSPGSYGIKGIPNAENSPPARFAATGWVDLNGNFWILGGYTIDVSGNRKMSNDLWKYDIKNNIWIWMKGSNQQNQRGEYGTKGIEDIMNSPGARRSAISWTDKSGNLWLFGGTGFDKDGNSGVLNDLWKFNTSSGNWIWIHGTNLRRQNGIYGTEGVADVNNMPGGREKSVGWIDNSGNFWMFGGDGMHANGSANSLGDLWKYDVIQGAWTWINGTSDGQTLPNYGSTVFIPSRPGGRQRSVAWKDSQGNLWLYGGYGIDKNYATGRLSDLWNFDFSKRKWVWTSGSNIIGELPVYGNQGVENLTNTPGGRYDVSTWVGKNGEFWLFGGFGIINDTYGIENIHNDLWKLRLTGNPNDVEFKNDIPLNFSLYQNYPNPFNPSTTIEYTLPTSGTGKIEIFDAIGRLVKSLNTENKSAGTYKMNFDSRDANGNTLASGVYYYRLVFGEKADSKKMLLLK